MATADADVAAIERELIVYEQGIPELLEMDTPLLSKMESTPSDPASNRSTRIPLLVSTGGTAQQVSMDGADLGATSGPVWAVATLVPIYITSGFSFTTLAEYATKGSERGVKSAVQEIMRIALDRHKSTLDVLMNTAGNGVIGTITSVSTNDLTLTTDGFKSELPYVGMPVQVFNAALTTDRGSTIVTAINRATHVVSVAAAPGGTTATDVLVFEGLAATVTINSSMFGVKYHQSDAVTGTWMGLNRATYVANIVTPSVDASSSSLTTAMIRQALNKIRMAIGDKAARDNKTKLTPYMHPAQADAYEGLAIQISQIFKEPSGTQGVDLMFGNEDNLYMSGLKVSQSIHADRTRIDFLCLGFWGKIVGTDTGFYKVNDQILFPEYGTAGNSLKSAKFFYLQSGMQIYNRNPLAGSYIKSLAVPAGY